MVAGLFFLKFVNYLMSLILFYWFIMLWWIMLTCGWDHKSDICKVFLLTFYAILRLLSWVDLSEAIAVCAIDVLKLKSILGVGPKVKDSIEDPFR
jgi:hypothetical protein